MNETTLREQICEIGRQMHRFQFADGTSGNISARLPDGTILMTPSGLAKGFMYPEQLIIVDTDGNRLDEPTPANADLHPTSESLMHLEAYKKRPDVGGVIHAHPPHAVALTIAGLSPQTYTLPETLLLMGEVPVTPYATPASAENRDAITDLIEDHDAILLAYHGSLTVGADVWKAYMVLETLEHAAHIITLVHALGGGPDLPPEQLDKLRALGKGYNVVNPAGRYVKQP
ncbi:MAG: class II aldolase/adducin family protein [Anaerolineales bacterium]